MYNNKGYHMISTPRDHSHWNGAGIRYLNAQYNLHAKTPQIQTFHSGCSNNTYSRKILI